MSNQSADAEDLGRKAIRRFIADMERQPSKRLQAPPPEPEPVQIAHPDWFGPAWREALKPEKVEKPDPGEAVSA